MPAEKVGEHGSNAEVEYVIGRGFGARKEQGKDDNLEQIGEDRQHHGGAKARTCRDFDGVLFHVSLPISWWCLIRLFYGANAVAGT